MTFWAGLSSFPGLPQPTSSSEALISVRTGRNFFSTFNYLDRRIEGEAINGREPQFPAIGRIGDRVTHSRSFSGTLASTFTNSLVNEFRGGWTAGENAFLVVDPLGLPLSLDFNNITDPAHEPGNGNDVRTMRNWHVRDTLSWLRGNHQFKGGFEWRRKSSNAYSLDEVLPDIDFDWKRRV